MSRRKSNLDYKERRRDARRRKGKGGVLTPSFHGPVLVWECPICADQYGRAFPLGKIIREGSIRRDGDRFYRSDKSHYAWGELEVIDGPHGHTKLRGRCDSCSRAGRRSAPEMRWEKLDQILDDLDERLMIALATQPKIGLFSATISPR